MGLFSNDLQLLFKLMNPILYFFNNETLNQKHWFHIGLHVRFNSNATPTLTLEPLNPGILEPLA